MPRRARTVAAVIIALLAAVPPAFAAQAPWWTHAVIYEIYPRSFQDTDGDGVGDLKGVTLRLDYLQKLGVDAIWLTPFYPSPNADFGYDVSDYTNVAPEYGTMADWDALAREANKRGIRILVDLVLNHSSDQHPWFKESRSSIDNPKRDWYIWRNGAAASEPPTHWESIFGGSTWTLDPATQQWYYHIFLPQQPDLNWASPGLRQAMFEVVRFWLDHGASGFRLDATPYLFEDPALPDDPDPKSGPPVWLKPYNSGRPESHKVLHDLRTLLNGYAGERVLLGESATATIEELAAVYGSQHDEINLPMDFLFGNLTHLDAPVFKKQVDDAEFKLKGQPPVFFFSSHDHSRQWSSFGDGVHNDQIAKLTAALTLAPRGTVLMYYGEEIGMGDLPATELMDFPLGPNRPRADERDKERTPMQWAGQPGGGFTQGVPWLPIAAQAKSHNVADEKGNPSSIYDWYAQLLRLRRNSAVFRDGAYVPLDSSNPHVFVFARRTEDGQGALVVLNTSNQEQQAKVAGWRGNPPSFHQVLMASPAAAAPPSDGLHMAPFGVLIAAFGPANCAHPGVGARQKPRC
jgi:alpha-glucosidase